MFPSRSSWFYWDNHDVRLLKDGGCEYCEWVPEVVPYMSTFCWSLVDGKTSLLIVCKLDCIKQLTILETAE